MIYKNLLAPAALILLMLVQSCSSRFPQQDLQVDDFKTLRDYFLPTQDVDPQPNWALNDNRIIVRSQRGIGVLDEGRNKRKFYNLKDARRIGWPTWLDDENIIIGSAEFMVVPKEIDLNRADSGDTRVTQSHVSMSIISAHGLKLDEKHQMEGVSAYYTQRISKNKVLAQKGESIVTVTTRGDIEVYDQGFFARPQPDGVGVAFQTVPVIEKDYWTGKKGNGDLIVRWKKGHVSIFPSLIQARWCSDGGIIATRLNAVPTTPDTWHSVASDIVYIAANSDEMRVVLTGAHSPDPHPTSSVAAVFVPSKGIYLLNCTDSSTKFLVADGWMPQWNYDGTRLLTEIEAKDAGKDLRVWVFQSLAEEK